MCVLDKRPEHTFKFCRFRKKKIPFVLAPFRFRTLPPTADFAKRIAWAPKTRYRENSALFVFANPEKTISKLNVFKER